MSKVHGKNAKVYYAQFDHSNQYRNAEADGDAGLSDVTCFGDGGMKTIPGLADGAITLEGLFDGDANSVEEELNDDFQAATGKVLTVAWEGSTDVGKRCALLEAREATVSVVAPISDVVQTIAEFHAEAGIDHGVGLHALAAETGSANGSSHDNAVSTAFGAVGHLHVTAIAGAAPSVVVKIQHSTDDSVWVDLITFSAATAATSERIAVTGTVNRYVRAIVTFGGTTTSVTFAVAVSRKRA